MVFKDKTVNHHYSDSFSNSGSSTVMPEILSAVFTSTSDSFADRFRKVGLVPEEITHIGVMGYISMAFMLQL